MTNANGPTAIPFLKFVRRHKNSIMIGLLLTLVGVMVEKAIDTTVWFGDSSTAMADAPIPCENVKVDVRAYNTIPYYWAPTIMEHTARGKKEHYLYWFYVSAGNTAESTAAAECPFPLYLRANFKIAANDNAKATLSSPSLRLNIAEDPDKAETVKYDPGITLKPNDESEHAEKPVVLEIEWYLSRNSGMAEYDDSFQRVLVEGGGDGSKRVTIRPRNYYIWNWLTEDQLPETWLSDGKWVEIPKNFIFAGLAAWGKDRNRSVRDTSKSITDMVAFQVSRVGNDMDEHTFEQRSLQDDRYIIEWIKTAYRELYASDNHRRIKVTTSSVFFPVDEREVTLPSTILSDLSNAEVVTIDALEAALLFAAVAYEQLEKLKDRTTRFGILMAPSGGTEGSSTQAKRVYFFWTLSGGDIVALDMGNAGAQTYEQNKSNATQKVKNYLSQRPEVEADLEDGGVYYREDSDVLALGLPTASERFDIVGISHYHQRSH